MVNEVYVVTSEINGVICSRVRVSVNNEGRVVKVGNDSSVINGYVGFRVRDTFVDKLEQMALFINGNSMSVKIYLDASRKGVPVLRGRGVFARSVIASYEKICFFVRGGENLAC